MTIARIAPIVRSMTRRSALALVTMLAGCSASAVHVPTSINQCTSALDCGSDAMCSEFRCVARQASTSVGFIAAPSRTALQRSFAPVTLAPRELRSNATVDLTLARAREVRGWVRTSINGQQTFVSAVVRFQRVDSDEPGVSVFASATEEESTSGFSVFLPIGTYDVFVEPREVASTMPMTMPQTRPPFVERGFTVRPSDQEQGPQPYLIAYSEPLAVTGFIVDRELGAGVGGLLVRAVDSKGALISTRSTTATGSGAFNLGIMLRESMTRGTVGGPTWFLEVSSAEPPSSSTAREAQTTARMVYRIASSALSADGSLTGLQVRIPGLSRFDRGINGACNECVAVEATVERAVPTPGEPKGLAASVYMRSTLEDLPPGHQAWFEVLARTNSTGAINTAVLPGTYQVTITPEDEPYALTQSTLRVSTMVRGRTFEVPLKRSLDGFVRGETTNTVAMSGVTIEALALDAGASTAPIVTARSATTQSLDDGSFSLRLDPGRYLIIARPPSSTGFASILHPVPVEVGVEGSLPPIMLVARPPIAIEGHVYTPGGIEGAAAASIEAFARFSYVGAGGAMRTMDVRVAETFSNTMGEFDLLLPPGLALQP
jgi:hypothetical protein